MGGAVINAGANIEAKNEGGWTPLHVAAIPLAVRLDLVRGHGEARDEWGGEPSDRLEIGQMLIDSGADLNARTESDQTSLQIAEEYKCGEFAEMLRKNMN